MIGADAVTGRASGVMRAKQQLVPSGLHCLRRGTSTGMALVRLGLSLEGRRPMLRLVLLALYLFASYSLLPPTEKSGGADPSGLTPTPPPAQSDGGGGWDPLG